MFKSFSIMGLALAVTFAFSLQASSQPDRSDIIEIKTVIQGAVEDNDWMKAADKEEVQVFLSNYFTGELLDNLVEQTWSFVQLDTDWYATASVEKILVNSIEGNTVTVTTYIKEKNIIDSTISAATGEFILQNTNCGWRISQMIITE